MVRHFDAVLFDLDDTLHDDTYAFETAAREVADEVEVERAVSAAALQHAYVSEAARFWHGLSSSNLQQNVTGTRERMWAAALKSVGLSDEALAVRCAHRYNAYRNAHLAPFPGAVELLRDLRGRGSAIGLLTNGFSETHREKIATLQIGAYFDALFMPDEVGMCKPDPLLFAHACATLGAAPERSAMVGDRYERDVRGAKSAGLFAIWMNLRGESLPAGAPQPDATVPDIAGVRAVLLG